MSFTAEAADLLSVIAGASGSKKERRLRAWRHLTTAFPRSTWTENRVRDVERKDPRIRVRADEMDQLRSLVREMRDQVTLGRAEYNELLAQIQHADRAIDYRPHNRRPTTDRLRAIQYDVGGDAGAVDS